MRAAGAISHLRDIKYRAVVDKIGNVDSLTTQHSNRQFNLHGAL